MKYPISIAGFAFACAMSFSAAAAPPASASGCADCHGEGGVSSKSDIPTIAGMSEFYLEGQMQAYQKAQRPCTHSGKTDMCEISKKMSAADVKEASTYFSGLKFVAAKQATDASLVGKGKALHAASCEICHSDGGSQAADDAGILAGQWKAYTLATLKEYHDGKRTMPEKMKPAIGKLSDSDMAALAEFYASEGSK